MRGTIERCIEHAARRADEGPGATRAACSAQFRRAVAQVYRKILSEEVRVCGSRPFAVGHAFDQVRRDLELFVLQPRLLEPAFARSDERWEAV